MKRAVLLFSMGGPRNLEEVQAFLFKLFSDPAILRLPAGLRHALAFVISRLRAEKAKKIYEKMGGGSPLLANTLAQGQALEKEIGGQTRCFVGMSYSEPSIEEAVKAAVSYGPEEIVLLPLYPQYSTATTESVLRDASAALKKHQTNAKIKIIRSFPEEKGFIETMAEQARDLVEKANLFGAPRLLLSAHGLPEKIVAVGDPYPQECEKTARAIMQKIGYENLDWVLCYQSRVGPTRWIGPETEAEIIKAARDHRPIVVAPISFVCEHAETLVELEQGGRALAEREGCLFFAVCPTVSTSPAFIKGLARLVTNF